MSKAKKLKTDEIIIFKTEDEKISVDVRFEDEAVWLTQQQMAELFQTSRTNVVEHIKHIYEEGELNETATCRNFRQVQKEGKMKTLSEVEKAYLETIKNVQETVDKKGGNE